MSLGDYVVGDLVIAIYDPGIYSEVFYHRGFLANNEILVRTSLLKILRVGMYIKQLSIVNHISSIYFITNTCSFVAQLRKMYNIWSNIGLNSLENLIKT